MILCSGETSRPLAHYQNGLRQRRVYAANASQVYDDGLWGGFGQLLLKTDRILICVAE